MYSPVAYFAAQEGHFDCVTWLVEVAKADPTIASRDGMTPLHAAAQTGQFKIVYWLVRTAHCPVNCQTQDGATPVHFAAAKGKSIMSGVCVCVCVCACVHKCVRVYSPSCNVCIYLYRPHIHS